MTADEVNKLTANTVITPNEGRVLMGIAKSDNKDLDRFQSTLNTVFLDKKEAYQDTAQKGGEQNDKRFGNASDDDATGSGTEQ